MQMTLAMNAAVNAQEKGPNCDKEKEADPGWTSRVNNNGSKKYNNKSAASGTKLYENMVQHRKAHEKKSLGVVPEKTPGTKFSIKTNVSDTFFPIQAHHLIPKNFLPKQPVCVWLTNKYEDNPKYQLKYDSEYDTDHHHNGYCMPYASALKEWKGNYDDKFALGCKVMDVTGIQLHQGSHPVKFDEKEINKRFAKPLLPIKDKQGGPDSDADEEDEIETAGYLDKVKLLLKNVHTQINLHVKFCEKCQQEKDSKIKVIPLRSTVDMMDEVSYIVKSLIESRVIFVSWYAYAHAFRNELIYGDPENFNLSDEMAELLEINLGKR